MVRFETKAIDANRAAIEDGIAEIQQTHRSIGDSKVRGSANAGIAFYREAEREVRLPRVLCAYPFLQIQHEGRRAIVTLGKICRLRRKGTDVVSVCGWRGDRATQGSEQGGRFHEDSLSRLSLLSHARLHDSMPSMQSEQSLAQHIDRHIGATSHEHGVFVFEDIAL